MSENRFQAPYQAVQERHEETRLQALEVFKEAGRQIDTWETEHPRLERRLGRGITYLWRERLGLRPFPRPWRKLPVMPRRQTDRRLRRLRRVRLGGYKKKLRRISGLAKRSWPARRRRLGMAWAAFRLRVSPVWVLLLLAVVLGLVLTDASSIFEDFFDMVLGGR